MAYSKSHYQNLAGLLLEFNIMALIICSNFVTRKPTEGTGFTSTFSLFVIFLLVSI